MHKLYNWMPYGEIECSNLARGDFTGELGCPMAIMNGDFGHTMANLNADWRMWLP